MHPLRAASSGAIRRVESGVRITYACVLTINPIRATALRIRCAKESATESPSQVQLPQTFVPAFKLKNVHSVDGGF